MRNQPLPAVMQGIPAAPSYDRLWLVPTRLIGLVLATFVLLMATGCQPSISSQLEGKWRGTPDTRQAAAERKARQESAEANSETEEEEDPLLGVEDDPTLDNRRTDLEGVEVAIELNFLEGGKVEMSREGGESYRGVWRVIERIPPKGAEIEISRLADDDSNAQGEEPKIAEKRRFTLEFQNDGQTPGFLLKEKGADPQFGQLYFRKQ